MKLTQLDLRDFTVFDKAELQFSPGLNFFIGANGAGKTHLLKVMYAALSAISRKRTRSAIELARTAGRLTEKLENVFRPDAVERLIRRTGARRAERSDASSVTIHAGAEQVGFSISQTGKINVQAMTFHETPPIIFLPPADLLALYEFLISTYKIRNVSLDETYYDTCLALRTADLRGTAARAVDSAAQVVEEILQGRITRTGERFYWSGTDRIEAPLMAEGHRKLGVLARLIRNGSIKRGGILFWDEPEASLNPRLIAPLVDVVRRLAVDLDVQIFIATHDYLLSQKLSLAKEFSQPETPPMRFFSFVRTGHDATRVDDAETIDQISDNPILDAFTKHTEVEHKLLRDEMHEGG